MTQKDNCEIYCYNEEVVVRIQQKIKHENIEKLSRLFKVLADENRAKIAYALTQEKELCVCDMANIIGSSVATASHHARTLKKTGLTTIRKEGKMVFYSLENEESRQWLMQMFSDKKKVTING